MPKPELLLPAGSPEMFYATIQGGADAVYAGVKNFNARNRAKNFSFSDIYSITQEAHKQKKKVYITLNTIVKNAELSDLLNTINNLNRCNVDAIIFQDLAVLNIVKKLYRNIELHASTQFGIHNSIGVNFLYKNDVRRSILSREVNLPELETIAKNKNDASEIEVFVHGALCYSFSGQCLFSSYLGGYSANRGMCAQVCRREFQSDKSDGSLFSMKDLELIEFIPKLIEIGVKSLKIEGRMKSPDYAFTTAKAYKMVINDIKGIEKAKDLLKSDFAREKTTWFIGKKLDDAITTNQGAGIYVGKIKEITKNGFKIDSQTEIDENHRLRCRNAKDTEAKFVNIDKITNLESEYHIICDTTGLNYDDEVYIVGTKKFNYKSLSKNVKGFKPTNIGFKQSQKILSIFKTRQSKPSRNRYYLRVSQMNILKQIRFLDGFEKIIIKVSYNDLQNLSTQKIDSRLKSKFIIELPKFISELKTNEYRDLLKRLFSIRYTMFSLSHISQKDFLPTGAGFITNESVYALNDIAINYIQSEGAKEYVYPYENEYPNLLKGRDRTGIIPIYYHPELFYSRMPVKSGEVLKDTAGKKYHKTIYAGFTIIYPDQAVSLTHNVSKFKSKGFNKFLIDISYENDAKKLQEILKSAKASSKIQGTSDFNMKKGLR